MPAKLKDPKYPTPPKMPTADEVAARFDTLSDNTFVRARVVQRLLDISHSTYYRLVKDASFPPTFRMPPGNDARHKVSDIRKFISSLKSEA